MTLLRRHGQKRQTVRQQESKAQEHFLEKIRVTMARLSLGVASCSGPYAGSILELVQSHGAAPHLAVWNTTAPSTGVKLGIDGDAGAPFHLLTQPITR
jgi:hypothetical protein